MKLPLLSEKSAADKPSCVSASAASLGGFTKFNMVDLSDVPMVEASNPLLDKIAIAALKSSIETPIDAAVPPAYCKARPKSCIPNFDLLFAV